MATRSLNVGGRERSPGPRRAGRRGRARWLAVGLVVATLAGVAWRTAGPSLARRDRLGRADRALDAGRLDEAEGLLRAAIVDTPDRPRPRLVWARLMRARGRAPEAERALMRAVQLGLAPDEGRREYALLLAPRDFPLAEGALQQVLKGDPRDEEASRALAEGYARAGRWAEAERAYSRWLDAAPDRLDARLGRARARWETGRWPEARDDYREAQRREPGNFAARLMYADCLLNDAKLAEAEPELLACRRLRPDRPEPLVGLAACAVERGEHDRARGLLDEALALDPDFTPALRERGDLDVYLRRFADAIPSFERAVRLDPRDERSRRMLDRLLHQTGRPDPPAEAGPPSPLSPTPTPRGRS